MDGVACRRFGTGQEESSAAGEPAPRERSPAATLEGGFHEGLALLRVLPPGLVSSRYPPRTPSKLWAADERSQPASHQHVLEHDEDHGPHHEGREQDERHGVATTPPFVLADIVWGFLVTRSPQASNAEVTSKYLSV
jgi:hypothetical protein